MEDMLFFNALSGMSDVLEDILAGFYFDNDFVGEEKNSYNLNYSRQYKRAQNLP